MLSKAIEKYEYAFFVLNGYEWHFYRQNTIFYKINTRILQSFSPIYSEMAYINTILLSEDNIILNN